MSEDWKPRAGLEALRQRARLLGQIRQFFSERDVLEVETPALARAGVTDPQLHNLSVAAAPLGTADATTYYLQTSPEYAMKRLLAAHPEAIFQVSRAFRDRELGRLHNPEFTLLEWYRPGFNYQQLMDEVAALVTAVGPWSSTRRVSYAQAFRDALGVDPLDATESALRETVVGRDLMAHPERSSRAALLDLMLSHCIAPQLAGPVFVYDYPASQAALAAIRPDDPPVAERFELFIDGVEIANGFHELTDAAEQRRRFEDDNRTRAAVGQPQATLDERLLAALESGLVPTSGVALGIDRLLMLIGGYDCIADVIAFPFENC